VWGRRCQVAFGFVAEEHDENPVGGKLSACDRERADAALTEEANRCISPLPL